MLRDIPTNLRAVNRANQPLYIFEGSVARIDQYQDTRLVRGGSRCSNGSLQGM